MKVEVQSLDASKKGSIELNDAVFGIEPRADILHRVVTWQLEKRRAPTRATRERSDVARSGKKFGRQKGGGTAVMAIVAHLSLSVVVKLMVQERAFSILL